MGPLAPRSARRPPRPASGIAVRARDGHTPPRHFVCSGLGAAGMTWNRRLVGLAGVGLLLIVSCGDSGRASGSGLSQMLDTYEPTDVEIAASGADGESSGTGFAWENGQQVVTNAHVVNGAASIKVNDPLKPGTQYSAVVVGLSACDDVALLRVERANFKPARMGDSK